MVRGRPKVYAEDRVSTAIRLPVSLHDRMRAAAEERDIPMNRLVESAVARYLEDLPPLGPSESRASA